MVTSMIQAEDAYTVLAARAGAGEDVFQEVIAEGMKHRERGDAARWAIGDLALLVDKRYGENRIAEFAKGIGQRVSAVREYRTVCRFWTTSARTEFVGIDNLTYSHFKLAARLKDLDAARDFLYDAADNDWTSERAGLALNERLGRPLPPPRLLDAVAWLATLDTDSGRLVLDLERGVDPAAFDALTPGRRVRLVLTEATE